MRYLDELPSCIFYGSKIIGPNGICIVFSSNWQREKYSKAMHHILLPWHAGFIVCQMFCFCFCYLVTKRTSCYTLSLFPSPSLSLSEFSYNVRKVKENYDIFTLTISPFAPQRLSIGCVSKLIFP